MSLAVSAYLMSQRVFYRKKSAYGGMP